MRTHGFLQVACQVGLGLCLSFTPGVAQREPPRVGIESGVAGLFPTKPLSEGLAGSTKLRPAVLVSAGAVLVWPGGTGVRLRGLAGLTGGTRTRITSGPGSGTFNDGGGRFFAGLVEALVPVWETTPALGVSLGGGLRWYRFEDGDCAGPCPAGRDEVSPAGSLGVTLSALDGRLGMEAGAVASGYSSRLMLDLLLGIRARW